MSIRLIASDLDGTLLDRQGRLPAGAFACIRKLKEKGILFAAASGRQFANLERLFYPVRQDMAFICENGAYTVAGDKRTARYFDPATARQVIEDILRAGLEVLISRPEISCLLSSGSKAFTDDIIYRLRNNAVIVDDYATTVEDCIKISGFARDGIGPYAAPLQAKWQEKMHVDIAGACWLDFTLANKGEGIDALADLLQIDPEDMAAFGDQFNDVSMLNKVGHPFLMTTAPEELRRMGFAPCENVLDTMYRIIQNA